MPVATEEHHGTLRLFGFAGHILECWPKSLWLESACWVGGTYSYRCVWRCWGEENSSVGVQSELNVCLPGLSFPVDQGWMTEPAGTNRKIGAVEVCAHSSGGRALGWSLYCAVCEVRATSYRLQSRKPGFNLRPIRVTLVVDNVSLWQVSLPVFQFSPVSIIPPMFHTHSFTYHPHYIMFLSQYFSFPLSVTFHQCSIPIHSPTTHTI